MCDYVHVGGANFRGQRRVSDPQEMDLPLAVNHLMCKEPNSDPLSENS